MLTVDIDRDRVRIGDRFSVAFRRTLRIPDDGKTYPLPPGLGSFPIHRVDDYRDSVPRTWKSSPGVFFPMYQREALWLGFNGASWKPNAVKVGIGGVNIISGEPLSKKLRPDQQDYIVCPQQPWVDGIKVGDGLIRQFVAMPLGQGYTVEAQITGAEISGGIQILVFEPKPGHFPDEAPASLTQGKVARLPRAMTQGPEMGLGAGGMMEQKIYPDPYEADIWNAEEYGSIFVYIVNSAQYRDIIGKDPPPTPISAQTYTENGFPWFALYDEKLGDVEGGASLASIQTIREKDEEIGALRQDSEEPINLPDSSITRLSDRPPYE